MLGARRSALGAVLDHFRLTWSRVRVKIVSGIFSRKKA
jgi:hypothetical protein